MRTTGITVLVAAVLLSGCASATSTTAAAVPRVEASTTLAGDVAAIDLNGKSITLKTPEGRSVTVLMDRLDSTKTASLLVGNRLAIAADPTDRADAFRAVTASLFTDAPVETVSGQVTRVTAGLQELTLAAEGGRTLTVAMSHLYPSPLESVRPGDRLTIAGVPVPQRADTLVALAVARNR